MINITDSPNVHSMQGVETIGDVILRVVSMSPGEVRAKQIVQLVQKEKPETSESSIRNELAKLKNGRRLHQPRNGYYQLPGTQRPTPPKQYDTTEYIPYAHEVEPPAADTSGLRQVVKRPTMVWRRADGSIQMVLGIYMEMAGPEEMGSFGVEEMGE